MRSILMVCLGNICRSPMAEAMMRYEADKAGLHLHVDSAGTAAYHIGKAPDRRTQHIIKEKIGVDIGHYKARQICAEDFDRFDFIFAMDEQNLIDIHNMQANYGRAQIYRLLDGPYAQDEIANDSQNVADPYYGDLSDFEAIWHPISGAARLMAQYLTNGKA